MRLFLPILFPSWRFFSSIGPAPQIQWRWVERHGETPWQPLYPKPRALTWRDALTRLVFNPRGNEILYLYACAEKYLETPDPLWLERIHLGLAKALHQGEFGDPSEARQLQIRLLRCCQNYPAPPVCELGYCGDPIEVKTLRRLYEQDTGLLL